MTDVYNPWFAAAIWSVGAAMAAWLAFPTSSALRAARSRFVSESGAYLDPSFLDSFDARTRQNYRLRALSLLVLVTGGVIAFRQAHLPPTLVMAPLLGVSLALESVDRLRGAGREFAVPESRSAIARPRRVALSDYVPWHARILTWGGVAIVLVVATGIVRHRQEVAGAATVLAVIGATAILAAAAFTAWFGRALCQRPTPAVDASHLYLQDAWRADSLERADFQLRLGAVLFTQGAVVSADELGYGLSMGAVASGIVILIGSLALPRKHFRQRLWGTLLPGQVLLPGQPVPPRVGVRA